MTTSIDALGDLTPREFYIDMCKGLRYKLNSVLAGIHLSSILTYYSIHFNS